MDPLACLNAAIEAREAGDHAVCADHLSDYFEWRAKGGFEPLVSGRKGDTVAAELTVRTVTALRGKQHGTRA